MTGLGKDLTNRVEFRMQSLFPQDQSDRNVVSGCPLSDGLQSGQAVDISVFQGREQVHVFIHVSHRYNYM